MGFLDWGSSGNQSTHPAGVRTTTRSPGAPGCVPTQSLGTSFLQVLQRFQRVRLPYSSAVHTYSDTRCASPVPWPPEARRGTSPAGRSSPSPVGGGLEWGVIFKRRAALTPALSQGEREIAHRALARFVVAAGPWCRGPHFSICPHPVPLPAIAHAGAAHFEPLRRGTHLLRREPALGPLTEDLRCGRFSLAHELFKTPLATGELPQRVVRVDGLTGVPDDPRIA